MNTTERKFSYDDVLAARQDINQLIYSYGEAAEYAAEKKWEADQHSDDDSFYRSDRYTAPVEALRQLLPAIREAMSKHSPEIWAHVLTGEAEEAAEIAERDAHRLAKAQAKGFDSWDAMQEAELKARRSASAKKAAETRKHYAELGFYKTPKQKAEAAEHARRQAIIDGLVADGKVARLH
jgi:electron transfer flavoprotein alpha subunit